MPTVMGWLPFFSSSVSIILAILLFRRYALRKGPHLLVWGIGMVFFAIAGVCEEYYTARGWNPTVFRLWYLFGAILVAAWLGQGTVYLLARRRWAHVTMALLALVSLYAAVRAFGFQLDLSAMTSSPNAGSELSGKAIVSSGALLLTVPLNVYGTVTLVGGAAWSAWIFWRKRILLHRTIGNILIASGALFLAFGGSLSRMGVAGAQYVSELVGVVLLFAGFLRATTPSQPASSPATRPRHKG